MSDGKILAGVVVQVSYANSAFETLKALAILKMEAPPFAHVQVWLRFGSKVPETPEVSAWCRQLVEGGVLPLLFDERQHKRPRMCLGRTGVALSSGMLEHSKNGAHITITGNVDKLTDTYQDVLAQVYQDACLERAFGAVAAATEPLPTLFQAPGASKMKPVMN